MRAYPTLRSILILSSACLALAIWSWPSQASAQLPPKEHRALMKKMQRIMKRKDLSSEEKKEKTDALMQKAMDRLKRRAQKKKKPPKFECNLTKGKSRGKYKIEGVGTLESAQPGSFVWLEIQKFKNVDAEFSIRNQKCGVGYTTQSDKVKVKFALDDPGLYVFSVHVDANDNRKQDEQIDWTGRIVDQATQKPLDVSGKKRSHKGLKFDITPSAATPAAVKTPMPDSPE